MNTDETQIQGGLAAPDADAFPHGEITREIIGAAFEVHRVLGYGFLERVYQRALQVELVRRGLKVETEKKITVSYKDVVVGDYVADLLVGGCVLIELKAAPDYCSSDEAQLLNELRATGVRLGMLINFGRTKVRFRRFLV